MNKNMEREKCNTSMKGKIKDNPELALGLRKSY